MTRLASCAIASVLLVTMPHAVAPRIQDERAEESARAQFRSAQEFVREGKYLEALRDFQAVVANFPASSVSDNALLEVARYHFEIEGNVLGAQAAITQLEQRYNGSDSTPMGHVLAGRLKTAIAQDIGDLDSAISEFDRVLRRFPRDQAVPAARLFRAEALQVAGRDAEALAELSAVTLTYSNSIWAARARIAAARSHLRQAQSLTAIRELQAVRSRFPESTEAATALELNTLLVRLYVRQPGAVSFVLAPAVSVGRDVRHVVALAARSDGSTFVATNEQVLIVDTAGVARSAVRAQVVALAVDPWDRPVVITGAGGVRWSADREFPLRVEKPRPKNMSDKVENPKPEYWYVENPQTFAVTPTEVVVADERRGLLRFGLDGHYIGLLSNARVDRILRDDLGHLLGLVRSKRELVRLHRDQPQQAAGVTRTVSLAAREPVDIAVDRLGHLYVLDRKPPSVHIYRPSGEPLAVFLPTGMAEDFKDPTALTVDRTGRLLVHDDRRRQVLVFE